MGSFTYFNTKYAVFSMLLKAKLLLIYASTIIEKVVKQKMEF